MNHQKKVIVAGHICLDITPIISGEKQSRLGDVLTPGKLLQVGAADVHTGGAVANTGLGMKILGADVSLMGKIGDDEFGAMVLNLLQKYNCQDSMVVDPEADTSYSVVLAVPGIDRIFLHNPGANNTFYASDISDEALEGTALLHFGYPPLMRSMYENDGDELVKIMKQAKDKGVATSLDMAAVDPASDAGKADWKLILSKVLPYVDFFVPSIEELCYMLDRPRFEEWQKRAAGADITEILDVETDIKPLAKMCLDLGAKVLLIKCGAPGMYFSTASKEALDKVGANLKLDSESWANKAWFEASYIPDCILSGTGAGDTSIAAFLTAMLAGYDCETTLHLAAATGASCVTAYDALSGLKPFDELLAKIQAGWKKGGKQC